MTERPTGPAWDTEPEPPVDEWEPAPERRDVPVGFGCVVLLVGLALLVAGVALIAVLVMALARGVGDEIDEFREDRNRQQADASGDAGVPTCSRNEFDELRAEVVVTNGSSKQSRYAVEVEFLAADGSHLDSSFDTVSQVAPGASATVLIDTLTPAPEEPFTCRVEQVDRWADED
jgi:hypothetical protein